MAAKAPAMPPLNGDEDIDALIHARITNDERPLRRLTKKFHTYASVAYTPLVQSPLTTSSMEEAREAFLIELASFQLLLRKSRMICDAERRQVGFYEKESLRIANEHTTLKNEIGALKLALEQAQLERRRKIEYDQVAEKINALPSREELEHLISELENDMQVIRDEQETQDRSILARKSTLDAIVTDIGQLRLLGKEVPKVDTNVSRAPSEAPSPGPTASGSIMDVDGIEAVSTTDGEGERAEGSSKSSSVLNPASKPTARQSTPLLQTATSQLRIQKSLSNLGMDSLSRDATPVFTPIGGPDSSPLSPIDPPSPSQEDRREEGEEEEGEEGEEAEDIEMGEVSEEKSGTTRSRKIVEDREEGEASDGSSVLSEPPDE